MAIFFDSYAGRIPKRKSAAAKAAGNLNAAAIAVGANGIEDYAASRGSRYVNADADTQAQVVRWLIEDMTGLGIDSTPYFGPAAEVHRVSPSAPGADPVPIPERLAAPAERSMIPLLAAGGLIYLALRG